MTKSAVCILCLAAMACAASDVASIDAVELGEASDMIQLREEVARLKAENKELKEANSVTSLGESNGFDASTCGTSDGADGKLHLNPPKATCGAGKRCTITAVEKIAYNRKILPCDKGKYATAENNIVARACKTCPNGKVAPAKGASSCDTCTAGKYGNAAKTACLTCASDGKYQDAAGQTSCKNCPSGRYSQGPSPYTACTLFNVKANERCSSSWTSSSRIFRRRRAKADGKPLHDSYYHSTRLEENCKKECAKDPECKYAVIYNKKRVNGAYVDRGANRRRSCVLQKATGCTMKTSNWATLYTKP